MYGVSQMHLNGSKNSVYSRCGTCIALLSLPLNVCCRRDHASASRLFTRARYSVSEYILFFLCTTICILYAGFSLRSPQSPAFQLGRTFSGNGGRGRLLMYKHNARVFSTTHFGMNHACRSPRSPTLGFSITAAFPAPPFFGLQEPKPVRTGYWKWIVCCGALTMPLSSNAFYLPT